MYLPGMCKGPWGRWKEAQQKTMTLEGYGPEHESCVLMMPKTLPLCTSAESNLRDRALGEAEKNSFIALPGKAGHIRFVPLKTVWPNWAGGRGGGRGGGGAGVGFGEEFSSNGSRAGLLIRIGVCAGPAFL